MDFEFTRGDTKNFKFQLKDVEGNLLRLDNDDKLHFTVKKGSTSKNIIFQKTLNDGISFYEDFYHVNIASKDTENLPYGTYKYDIELRSGDLVKTLILGEITITDEITFGEDVT